MCVIGYLSNYCWNEYFGTDIRRRCAGKNVVLVGVSGGSGKSTIARILSQTRSHAHICVDDYKYNDQWVRYSEPDVKCNVESDLRKATTLSGNHYVLDGTYGDMPQTMGSWMGQADLIAWNDIPLLIALQRKLLRSCRRSLGVEPQGRAPETIYTVFQMLVCTCKCYNKKRALLIEEFEQHNGEKYLRFKWPHFGYVPNKAINK